MQQRKDEEEAPTRSCDTSLPNTMEKKTTGTTQRVNVMFSWWSPHRKEERGIHEVTILDDERRTLQLNNSSAHSQTITFSGSALQSQGVPAPQQKRMMHAVDSGCSRKGHQSRNKTCRNTTCTEQLE